MPATIGALIIVSLAACVALAIQRLFFSSTSSIPGPWYTKVSGLYMAIQEMRGLHCQIIDSLFARYGPVICIAPGAVLFTVREDGRVAKAVYGSFSKDASPISFRMHNVPSVFTTVDSKGHLLRRRRVHTFWLPANLGQYREGMQSAITKLVGFIICCGGKAPLDALHLSHHLMIDVVALTVLGEQVGGMDDLVGGREHQMREPTRDFLPACTMRNLVPRFVWNLLRRVPVSRWKRFCGAGDLVWDFVANSIRQRKVAVLDEQRESLMSHLITTSSRSAEPITEEELIAECADHFIAGADFLSSILALTLQQLGNRPDIVQHLRSELLVTSPDLLESAPYLTAMVKEALRFHASAPGPLLRIIPPKVQDFKLSGHYIPPGTAVGVQAWSAHCDGRIFPDPGAFIPERWLAPTSAENGSFMPFGLGARDCVGKHFAMMALKNAVAAIVVNFDLDAEGRSAIFSPNQLPTWPPVPEQLNIRFTPTADAMGSG